MNRLDGKTTGVWHKKKERKLKDLAMHVLIYFSASLTVAILGTMIGFILYKGVPGINMDFLTRMWEDKTAFVIVEAKASAKENLSTGYVESLGISLRINEDGNAEIIRIDPRSPVKEGRDLKDQPYALKKGDVLIRADDTRLEDMTQTEVVKALNQISGSGKLKVVRPGGGIVPMLASTFLLIVLSLSIAAPIGILAAVYLNEYARPGRLLKVIRFSIQSLSGIPSIIYGLFGMMFFVQKMKMQYSILAGALTISILLLPAIIATTEEALKRVPAACRESSLGLGATKLQTNFHVVLPNALPGILVAVILSIGRIVGESAALVLTAGTIAQIPGALTGTNGGGATLTVKLYWLLKETADMEAACSIAVVLLVLIIMINWLSRQISKIFMAKGIH